MANGVEVSRLRRFSGDGRIGDGGDGTVAIALDPADGAWTNVPRGVLNSPARKLLHEMASSRVSNDLADREIRYQEALLRPSNRVGVFGRATMEIDPAGRASFRDPPMLNHMTGSEDDPVIVAHDIIALS